MKIYGLGEILIDFLPINDKEYGKLYKEVPGGAPANVVASLAQLGVESYFIGKVGRDFFGEGLIKSAQKLGVHTDYLIPSDQGRTALAFVDLDEQGERSFCFYRDNCADAYLQPQDIPVDEFDKEALLHIGSISTIHPTSQSATEYAMAQMREKGGLISYDPNLRPALWKSQDEMLEKASTYLYKADILKLSEEEVTTLFGKYDEKIFKKLLNTAQLIVVTHGAKGATAYTRTGKVFVQGFKVKAVDTTGAGDTFVAGILYKISEGLREKKTLEELLSDEKWLQEMLIFANANAALTTTQKGVFTAVSTLLKVNTFISQNQTNTDQEDTSLTTTQQIKEITSDLYRLNYHIMAPTGWINDPNGLIHFKDKYHVFYQYHPYSAEWGPMHWGHVSSKDLVNWEHEPIALTPDQPYESGCFSGSAVDDNGVMTLFYTAHNLDSTPKEVQCVARSYDDGKTFEKDLSNPVIGMYPKECSSDFRDPKVWKHQDKWYMIVGSGKHKKGNIPLYSSSDLKTWEYQGLMCEAEEGQGVMWECPNYCDLGEKQVLIVSPMEMKGHKNIFITGEFSYETLKFTQEGYSDIDLGDDFYAAQIFEDQKGRTILIGWMDMWGSEMPCQEYGWAGALTIPRKLSYQDGKVIQTPVEELTQLRTRLLKQGNIEVNRTKSEVTTREALGKSLEIKGTLVLSEETKFTMVLCASQDGKQRTEITFNTVEQEIVIDKTLSGKGNKKKNKVPYEFTSKELPIHIFVDESSIELFINNGEVVLSNRIYPEKESNYFDMFTDGSSVYVKDLEIHELKHIGL